MHPLFGTSNNLYFCNVNVMCACTMYLMKYFLHDVVLSSLFCAFLYFKHIYKICNKNRKLQTFCGDRLSN